MSLTGVFFDLDGTLADTAPDLIDAVLALGKQKSWPIQTNHATLRTCVSTGGRGLLAKAFGLQPEDPGYNDALNGFLEHYQTRLCVKSHLFPGIANVLDQLDQARITWGIVTNKHTRFALPLIEALQLSHRATAIVCGDTLATNKPDPAPLCHACALSQCLPEEAVYLGDDIRDVIAAKRAGMIAAIAGWGYLDQSDKPIDQWHADKILDTVADCLPWLQQLN